MGLSIEEPVEPEKVTVSLYIMTATKVISVDVTIEAVLSELDSIFALKEDQVQRGLFFIPNWLHKSLNTVHESPSCV